MERLIFTRWLVTMRLFVVGVVMSLLSMASSRCYAQITVNNILEYEALDEGTAELNAAIGAQTEEMTATAVEQNTIAGLFSQMKQWQTEYNNYLKNVEGYASSLKACSYIYSDGVKILLTLYNLSKALKDNPFGGVASISINNLLLETVAEAITTFTLLKEAVATGGSKNMITGAERSKTLWAIGDRFNSFYRKLNSLYLTVRYYSYQDIWEHYTLGMYRDKKEIANNALRRWKERGNVMY